MADDPQRPEDKQQGGEEERQGALFARLFTDDSFVEDLARDPEGALRQVGITLTDEQRARMTEARAEMVGREEATPSAIPAVVVVVRVATSPTVRVAVASSVEVRVATATSTVAAARFDDRGRLITPQLPESTEADEDQGTEADEPER